MPADGTMATHHPERRFRHVPFFKGRVYTGYIFLPRIRKGKGAADRGQYRPLSFFYAFSVQRRLAWVGNLEIIGGLDVVLSRQIMEFHKSRRIQLPHERTIFKYGEIYYRWCFADLATAQGCQAPLQFGCLITSG